MCGISNVRHIQLLGIRNTWAKSIYLSTHDALEKWTKMIFTIIFKVYAPLFMIPHVIQSAYKYWSSNYTTIESLNLVFPASVPYNWKSSIGYPFTICLQFLSILSSVVIFTCILTLYFGFRQFLLALVMDLKENTHTVNQIICSMMDTNPQKSPEIEAARRKIELKNAFHGLIQFHAEAKMFVWIH